MSELCNAIYHSPTRIVIIRRSNGEMLKINANNSIFAKSKPLIQIMDGRWIIISVNMNDYIINAISHEPSGIHITSDDVRNERVRDIIPRSSLHFKYIPNLKEIRDDERLSIRMSYIYSDFESITHSYELQVMSYLEPFVKSVNDTDLIIDVQKLCLVNKEIPVDFLEKNNLEYLSSCSPYMFFKVCEMALKYHMVSLDEFVYSLPCLPYVDYHSMNMQDTRHTLGSLRRIKDGLFEELEQKNELRNKTGEE